MESLRAFVFNGSARHTLTLIQQMGEDDDDCTLFDFVIEKVLLKEGSPTLAARVLARLDACEVKACNIKEAEAYELWNMLQQVSRQGLGKYVAPVVDDEDDAYMVRKKTTFGKSLSRELPISRWLIR